MTEQETANDNQERYPEGISLSELSDLCDMPVEVMGEIVRHKLNNLPQEEAARH